MKIAFIGAGKMAEALIFRLGTPGSIIASDIDKRRLNYLRARYKIRIAKNNFEAFKFGDVVVLAVKPQNATEVLEEIRKSKVERRTQSVGNKILISIAAGIPLKYLEKKLPGGSIIRAMPNNPAMVGAGMTALAKGKKVSSKQYAVANKIFRSVGEVVEVPERWMDAVTGLSGSGPAFVYLAIEALAAGGAASGLSKPMAEKLALQTALGAAQTVKVSGRPPRELREMVTSPGGTTIEGLKVLHKAKLFAALQNAVAAAAKKSKTLSKRWAT